MDRPRKIRKTQLTKKPPNTRKQKLRSAVRDWWVKVQLKKDPYDWVKARSPEMDYRDKHWYSGIGLHHSFCVYQGEISDYRTFLYEFRRVAGPSIERKKPITVTIKDDRGRPVYTSARTFYKLAFP